MQYVCLIYAPSGLEMPADEQQRLFAAYGAYSEEARKSGQMTGGVPLDPPDTATTVRVRDGKRMVIDGPFAETKEWLAGFYSFDCKSLDEALDWAAKIPGAAYGSIEVRPVMEIPGM